MKTLIILAIMLTGCAQAPTEQVWQSNIPTDGMADNTAKFQRLEDDLDEFERNHEVTKALYEINNSIIRNTIYGK